MTRRIKFHQAAFADMRELPPDERREVSYQLARLQRNFGPTVAMLPMDEEVRPRAFALWGIADADGNDLYVHCGIIKRAVRGSVSGMVRRRVIETVYVS